MSTWSSCCHALATVQPENPRYSSETRWFECSACGEPCDVVEFVEEGDDDGSEASSS